MELLVRGQYVITDAADGPGSVLRDGAVLTSGSRIAAVGDWRRLRRRHASARVVGDGKQLLMPGLVDAHSHGRALSPIQKGVLNDYLENNLLDWAFMPVFEPELTAALGACAHPERVHDDPSHGLRHRGSARARPVRAAIRTYLDCGIRLAFSPGVRNVDKLVLDSTASSGPCLRTSAPSPRRSCTSTARPSSSDYFALFDASTARSTPRTRASC